MAQYQMYVFDLDDTLAPSKSPLPPRMAAALRALLDIAQVCIISGGRFQQFETQVLGHLEASVAQLKHLHLMPTSGMRYYMYGDHSWHAVYEHELAPSDRAEAARVLEEEARRLGLWETETFGPVIEDRGSQITFSALGQRAPVELKKAWDPDGMKKERLRDAVAARLTHLDVASGGSTSVDVTAQGIDKAYGVRQLAQYTKIPLADMIFIGDRLEKGGNDYPVLSTGISVHAVKNWQDCAAYVEGVVMS
ncbi:MAG: HAD-IIB family hydrolase [Actinomycetaceae bacterium]|nr:HAD-IIB family hydrolase [Actinomycetaceae bacterium]MDY6083111.1 HAD-IIB family hydrolase [Actinomycetaceae bacterium]